MVVVKQQEDFLNKLLSEANENGKDRELRLFACYCARQTDPRKYCLEAIELSERYAHGLIGLDEMLTRQKEMVGFAVATTTIGMNHNLPLANSDLSSFQTLRQSALEAAMLSKSHYLSHITSKAEKEGLSLEQIDLLRIETITRATVKIRELLTKEI